MKQILPIASKVQKPIAIASSMSRLLKDIESRPLGAREHQQVPKQLSAVKRILPCGQLLSQAFAGRDSALSKPVEMLQPPSQAVHYPLPSDSLHQLSRSIRGVFRWNKHEDAKFEVKLRS